MRHVGLWGITSCSLMQSIFDHEKQRVASRSEQSASIILNVLITSRQLA